MKIISFILFIICSMQSFAKEQINNIPLSNVLLPHTDGGPLVEKLLAVDKAKAEQIFQAGMLSCNSSCVTPFATILGTADDAIGYSNCKSTCVKAEYSFMNLNTKAISIHQSNPNDKQLHYVGVIYQCVEYARRWWMLNQGITFGSIDSAFEILYLTEGKNIYTNKSFPLARSINGSATKPPSRGDLIIYGADRSNPNWRHGHVAVVVDVDLKLGLVSIAEENYNNKPWLNPKAFSRQLRLYKIGPYYRLLDVAPEQIENPTGASISGWIYPLNPQSEL